MSMTPVEPITVIVSIDKRDDGGVRVTAKNLRGLHLSGKDPDQVWSMIPAAITTLLRENHGLHVVSVRPSKSPEEAFSNLPQDVQMHVEHQKIFVVELEAA